MESVEELLLLTPKGTEALRQGTKLDPKAKLILALIERGANKVEALLQRSKATRDEVTEGLRLLARGGFVATATIPIVKPGTADAKPASASKADDQQTLKPGISPSHARFTLSNFCLDQFGTSGQDIADVIDLCTDVPSLQRVVNDIRTEVDKRCPDRLPAFFACVKEINDTDF